MLKKKIYSKHWKQASCFVPRFGTLILQVRYLFLRAHRELNGANPPRPAATPPVEGIQKKWLARNPLLGRGARSAGWVLALLCACSVQGALVAHYDFSDGDLLDNEVGAGHTLRPMKKEEPSFSEVRLNSVEGTAVFPGGRMLAPWLEADGPGKTDEFTISFWFRTDQVDQGDRFCALFSTTTRPNPPGSWTVHSNTLLDGGLDLLGRRVSQQPMKLPHAPGVWQHAVVRRIRDGEHVRLEMHLTPRGGRVGEPLVTVGGFEATLEKFVLGMNPRKSFAYRMELANVKIFDDADVSLNALFAEGPQTRSLKQVPLFSTKEMLGVLQPEIGRLDEELEALPQIDDSLQLDAYGYHSGYLPALEELPEEPRWVIELDARLDHSFNDFYLVPAADRRFVDMPGYGFPKRFRIVAINRKGEENVLADWRERDYPDPGRFPARFFGAGWSLEQIRLEVFRGQVEGDREFFALDEVLVRTDYFVIQAHAVEASASFESPPFWSVDYLIDQKTSLGLPSLPGNGDALPDYIRHFAELPDEPLVIELDLGQNKKVDMITLYPARPPEGVIVPGYGFPGSVKIQMFKEALSGGKKQKRVIEDPDLLNPGNNVTRFAGHSLDVRWVRLTFDKLPLHEGRPTFGLGEIALTGGGVVRHPQVLIPVASIGIEALVDGKANGLPVMPFNLWIDGLVIRKELTRRLDAAEELETRLDKRWQVFRFNLFVGSAGGVVVIALSFALFAIIQRRRHTKRLRRQISSDLHDDIGSKVAAISLASTDVERNASDARIRERGGQIKTISTNMHQGLRDVLWVTDTDTDLLDQLVRKLADTARLNISSKRLELKIPPLSSVPKRRVGVQIKRDLLLFFKEALHNAAVHSEAETIRADIQLEGRELLIRVEDDGKGFDLNAGVESTQHHGLNTMRERAKRMHAKVRIESALGKGTTLELRLNT